MPRWIGLRNYGPVGLQLPDVIKAENAASRQGQTLKDVRANDLASFIKPFDTHSTEQAGNKGYDFMQVTPEGVASTARKEASTSTGSMDSTNTRANLIEKIQKLAQDDNWVGSRGLSDLKKKGGKVLPQQTGALADIQTQISNATDPWNAYARVKNLAYPTDNSEASNKIASFMRAAAGTIREDIISKSPNPNGTRTALDNYADQTAIAKAKGKPIVGRVTSGGEAGLAALASFLPIGHALSLPLLADTVLTNPITGPATAKGLVNMGQFAGNTGASNLLRILGIAGANKGINAIQSQ